MTARLTPLLAAAALMPAAAFAQTPESGGGRLELVGEAPSACVIQDATALNTVNATVESAGANGSRIRIVQMVDNITAQPQPMAVDLTLPIICNSPHRLTVRTANGGLRLEGGAAAPSGDFASFVPYQVHASWAGQDISGESSRSGLGIDSAAGRAGTMSLSINLPPGGPRLQTGRYLDDIIIEFQAAN
jgi:hypothetical protein